jgi:hypothetical protein
MYDGLVAAAISVLHGCLGIFDVDPLKRFQLNDRWDDQAGIGLLRAALPEIEALGDELSPARAEVLLSEFERDVCSAFLRQDLFAVKGTCERYRFLFCTLAKKAKHRRSSPDQRIASSLRRARRVIHIGQRKAKGRDVNGAR